MRGTMRTRGGGRQTVRVVAWLLAMLAAVCPAVAQGIAWPAGKTSAVCLTHDDGLRSQLDHAIPQLDKRGFKGTFFLKGDLPAADLPRWAAAASNGHELGNHSFTHPCYSSYSFVQATGHAIDQMTPELLTADIARMDAVLQAIDGRTGPRSYAYPCYNRALVDGYFGMTPLADGSSAIEAVRASGLVSFARGGDERPVVSTLAALDPMYVPAVMFAGGTAADLLRHVDEAAARGGLVVISLHDIGGPALPMTVAEYETLLDALAARPEIWVTTFGEAMQHLQRQRGL